MYTTVDLPYISDTQFLAYAWAKKTFGKIKGEDGTLRGNDRIWFARSADDRAGTSMQRSIRSSKGPDKRLR